jgi:hypothetical protein
VKSTTAEAVIESKAIDALRMLEPIGTVRSRMSRMRTLSARGRERAGCAAA